jgi:peroxiredoxin Q/BCP
MVQVNQKAPKFSTVDTFGNGIDLLALEKKHRYVLIVFLRYSGCAFCNLAIHRLTMEYKQITKADCKIVAFVQSDKEKIIENIYDTHNPKPQFPIIPDKEMKFYKKYNVEPSVTQTLKMITNIPMWIESISKHSHVKKEIDENLFIVPAWFLVESSTNKIVKTERGSNFYGHDSFINIYDTLTFGK